MFAHVKLERFTLRVSAEQKARWVLAAGREDLSPWARRVLDEAAGFKPGDELSFRERLDDELSKPIEDPGPTPAIIQFASPAVATVAEDRFRSEPFEEAP